MPVRVVRLGDPRAKGEGLRLGTARRLPRGVRKSEYARRDYFDLWFPELAPSQKLLSYATASPWTEKRWVTFARRYAGEMRKPGPQRMLEALARLSHQASFSVGCYCEDATHCHRIVLASLLADAGATFAERDDARAR
jgi:uncharacterized protein YeaO (DUF488 family)